MCACLPTRSSWVSAPENEHRCVHLSVLSQAVLLPHSITADFVILASRSTASGLAYVRTEVQTHYSFIWLWSKVHTHVQSLFQPPSCQKKILAFYARLSNNKRTSDFKNRQFSKQQLCRSWMKWKMQGADACTERASVFSWTCWKLVPFSYFFSIQKMSSRAKRKDEGIFKMKLKWEVNPSRKIYSSFRWVISFKE